MIKNYRTVHRFRLPSVQEEVSGVHPNNAMGVELKGKSEKEKKTSSYVLTAQFFANKVEWIAQGICKEKA